MGKSFQGWNKKNGGFSLGASALTNNRYVSLLGSCNLPSNDLATVGELVGGAAGHVTDFGGTIRKLIVKIESGSNNRTVDVVFTVRKNEVATAATCTVTAGDSGYFTGTGEFTFVSGDYIDVSIAMAAGNGGLVYLQGVWCEMETTGGHFGVYTSPLELVLQGDIRTNNANGGGAAGIDYYAQPIAGEIQGNTWSYTRDATPVTPPPSRAAVHTAESDIRSGTLQRVRVPGSFTSGRTYVVINQERDAGIYPDGTCQTGLTVSGTDSAALYTFVDNGVGRVEAAWVDATQDVAVVDGDDVSYWATAYAAPLTYSGSPTTRTGNSITTQVRALNFAATTDADNPLDVFIPAAWDAAYTTPNRVQPGPLTGTFYAALAENADLPNATGELFNIADAEMTLPSCTEILNLRGTASLWTAGTVTVTLMVERQPTEQTFTITAAGHVETTGDPVIVAPDCRVCLQITTVGFTGTLDAIAFTQQASSAVDECVPCVTDSVPGGRSCPDNTLNFSDLKTATFGMLGEDAENPAYWSEAEIGRYVNDAYQKACRDTGALEGIEGIVFASEDGDGTLSDFVGPVLRTTWDDQKIYPATKLDMDRDLVSWETQTGTVDRYTVTAGQDTRTIRTYKAWDGSGLGAIGPWLYGGEFEYSEWTDGNPYVEGARVTSIGTDGLLRAYESIVGHTAVAATNKPETGSAWETYWTPLLMALWHKKVPVDLQDDWEPELPPWFHIAIAYRASARALRKMGEMRDDATADAYDAIAADMEELLRAYVANRTSEAIPVLAPAGGQGPLPPDVRLTPITGP